MSPILSCGPNGFGEQAVHDNTTLFRQFSHKIPLGCR